MYGSDTGQGQGASTPGGTNQASSGTAYNPWSLGSPQNVMTGALGGLGDLFGAFGSGQAMKGAENASNQDMSGMNQAIGKDMGFINQIGQNFFGPGGGAGAQSSLLQSMIPQILSGKTNWHGLQPGELSALQTSLGNSNHSLVNTLRDQSGGVANLNATLQNLGTQGQESNMNMATQLGGMAQQQDLSWLQSMLGATTDITGQQSSLLGSGMQGLQGIGQMYGDQAMFQAMQAQQAAQSKGSSIGGLGGAIGTMFGV